MIEKIVPIEFENIVSALVEEHGKDWQLKLSIQQLERVAQIKNDCEDLRKRFPILYYKPMPGTDQQRFHESNRRVRLVLGGNQSGKTHSSVAESIGMSLGLKPYCKIPTPNRGRMYATDLEHGIGGVIGPKMDELIPREEMDVVKKYPGGQYKKIFWKNGSTTEFMSYEQDDKASEGWTGNWVANDEPPPREKYIAQKRGLVKYNGKLWIAATPLDQPWMYDEIYLKCSNNPLDPALFVLKTRGNVHLDKSALDDFERSLTEDEKGARLYGKFRFLSGLVFKNFNPDINVIDAFDIPKEWPRYCAMDYHSRTPCAIVWIAVSPDNVLYIYDELWVDGTIKFISDAIKAKEKESGGNIRLRIIDSIAATPERGNLSSSPMREFVKNGLTFRTAIKKFSVGKDAVDTYLKEVNGVAGCYMFREQTRRTQNGFAHYQWTENTLREDPKKATGGDVHFVDATRYIMVMQPRFTQADMIDEVDRILNENNLGHSKTTGYGFGA